MKVENLFSGLSAVQWGYLVGLLFPVAFLHLQLRMVRLDEAGETVENLRWIQIFSPDLFLFVGFALVGLVLLAGRSGRILTVLKMFTLQLTLLFVTIVGVAGHWFYMVTGSSLDLPLVLYWFQHFDQLHGVIGSEITTRMIVLISLGVVGIAVGPWLVTWAIEGFLRISVRRSEFNPSWLLTMLFLGSSSVAGAVLPTVAETNTSLRQHPAIEIASTLLNGNRGMKFTNASIDYNATEGVLAPSADRKTGKRNIVFLILESTRARAVTPYNEDLRTTEFLDKLADKSLVAERAYAVVPHTSKSLVPIFCGIEPNLIMPITEATVNNIPARCLPELLADHDYKSAFFQSATRDFEDRGQLVENFGFNEFYPLERMNDTGFERANYFGVEDNVMLEPSRQWLKERTEGSRPFFAAYLTLTPHHQYLSPETYGHREFVERENLNNYLNAVRYVDRFTRKLFQQYRDLGLYENTIFVVLGDHGEGFGEHGRNQHDNVIWEEGLRVPLFIHHPGKVDQTRRVNYPVNHLDVLPTVVDLLGFEIESGSYPGDNIYDVNEVRPLHASCWYERRCMARIVGNEKYIHHFDHRKDQFFNLSTDPLEKTNIINDREGMDVWRSKLIEWRMSINRMYRSYNAH